LLADADELAIDEFSSFFQSPASKLFEAEAMKG
jgi:hypothetical protein